VTAEAELGRPGAEPLGIVFDLDGTLVDSRADIVSAVRFVVAECGGPPLSDDEIAGFVGDGARMLLSRVFRLSPGDPALDPILATFLSHYTEHAADRTTLLPHARSMLDALRALPLALCTNKPRAATLRVLSKLDLARHFEVVVAAGDLPENKPSPAPLVYIGEKLGVPTTRLVMVGDGTQDVECGRAAGARTIAVLGGFASRDRLERARPDVLVETLAEVPAALKRLGAQATSK
jgi:phosphoglycolate phosphatase